MRIKRVFSIAGRGVVLTGRIEHGTVTVGDCVYVDGPLGVRRHEVIGLENYRALLETAGAGEDVGITLPDCRREDFEPGEQVRTLDA